MGQVTVLSDDIHWAQGSLRAVEELVSATLAKHPGSWKVRILLGAWPLGSWVPAETASRVAVVVTRDDAPSRDVLLLDRGDFHPSRLAALLGRFLGFLGAEGHEAPEGRETVFAFPG
jgi:hypothetical protein